MTRPARTLTYTLLLVGGITALGARWAPPAPTPADEERKDVSARAMEDELAELARATAAAPETVLLFGDSSLLEHYTLATADALHARIPADAAAVGLAVRVVAHRGFDGIAYYALADAIAALAPRAVVLVANLQTFSRRWFRNPRLRHQELVAFLHPMRIPEALLLPLDEAGVADARILSAPVLSRLGLDGLPAALERHRSRFRALLDAELAALVAARAALAAEPARARRTPAGRSRAPGTGARPPAQRGFGRRPLLRQGQWVTNPFKNTDLYPDELTDDAPAVRVFRAALERLTRARVPTVVLLLPLHVEALRLTGAWTRRGVGPAVEVVRRAARESGASLLDLAQLLPRERYFVDAHTHFTAEGNARVARAVVDGLQEILARGEPHEVRRTAPTPERGPRRHRRGRSP